MSAALESGTEIGVAGFLARYEGLRELLPGDPEIRRAAAELFRRQGLRSQRLEAWKYTSLRPVAETRFHEPLIEIVPGARGNLDPMLAEVEAAGGARLIFVDGRYRADLSLPPTAAHFAQFAHAADFGRLARPEREPIVALNTMLAEDGAILDVLPETDAGSVTLGSIGTDVPGTPVAFHPRHVIRLGAGARLTVREFALGRGSYLHNPVTEIRLAPGAMLTHLRLQEEAGEAFHLGTIYLELEEGAFYDGFSLNLGARLARTEIHAAFAGVGARADMAAVQLLRGRQHGDLTMVVHHGARGCASRQSVKNVLDGRSRAVFQGRIEVAREAQKTDGYQMNQALLLSPEAEIDTKPELEIYADDVKCSHGATVGALDDEQLFYLQSRGVPAPAARAMLVEAFLAEAIDRVADEPGRGALRAAVERWWEASA